MLRCSFQCCRYRCSHQTPSLPHHQCLYSSTAECQLCHCIHLHRLDFHSRSQKVVWFRCQLKCRRVKRKTSSMTFDVRSQSATVMHKERQWPRWNVQSFHVLTYISIKVCCTEGPPLNDPSSEVRGYSQAKETEEDDKYPPLHLWQCPTIDINLGGQRSSACQWYDLWCNNYV